LKSLSLLILLFCITYFAASAQQSCMTVENIKALDAKWEEANLNPDPEFMESLLAENFIWVHNHYSSVDSKESVVRKAKNQKANGNNNTKSRVQKDVKVVITGNTAIVTGFTYVDRAVDPANYHFMRTYVEIDGKCLLAGNHTMAVPEEE
jgi:ketosteroid isomerase-like protein